MAVNETSSGEKSVRGPKAASVKRSEEAHDDYFGPDHLTAEEQRAENRKLKEAKPDKGGWVEGSTGAPINEGGSGVFGGVI